MAENFYVNTVGAVPANKLSEAVSLGVTLAEESKAAGSARASVGTIMTGNNAGSVVFSNFLSLLMILQMSWTHLPNLDLQLNYGYRINSYNAEHSQVL
jgi:hypothetical protein